MENVSPETSPRPQAGWSRWVHRAVASLLVGIPLLFALSQLLIWTVWNPRWGDSEKYVVTIAQLVIGGVLLLCWWFCYAPVSRRIRLGIGLPVVVALVAWGASIRSVDLDGHMRLTFHYRWETPDSEKLKEFRAHASTRSGKDWSQVPVPELQPEDIPAYRGVDRDGQVIGPEILTDWNAQPPVELWRHPVGGGYASVAIVDEFLITLEQREENEAIVCYEASTGAEIWSFEYPARFVEAMGGPGPRSTPTIDGDRVIALGACGDLHCVDLRTGAPNWHVNVLQQFQLGNTDWGMTASPLVDENRVIVNVGGGSGNGLAAYELSTGELIWQTPGLSPATTPPSGFKTGNAAIPTGTVPKTIPGYASPQMSEVAGHRIILNLDGTGLNAHDPATGKRLWSFPFENGPKVNVAQPLVFEDSRIFLSASYDVGSKMIRVTRTDEEWNVEQLWSNRNLRCKFTSPVLVNGLIYGLDEGIMVCLDPETGKRLWKGSRTGLRGRYDHGQLITTNGLILGLTENGQAVLVQPDAEKLVELSSMRVLSEGRNWNPLVLCRGRLFVRNASEMACYDLVAREKIPDPTPNEETSSVNLRRLPAAELSRLDSSARTVPHFSNLRELTQN